MSKSFIQIVRDHFGSPGTIFLIVFFFLVVPGAAVWHDAHSSLIVFEILALSWIPFMWACVAQVGIGTFLLWPRTYRLPEIVETPTTITRSNTTDVVLREDRASRSVMTLVLGVLRRVRGAKSSDDVEGYLDRQIDIMLDDVDARYIAMSRLALSLGFLGLVGTLVGVQEYLKAGELNATGLMTVGAAIHTSLIGWGGFIVFGLILNRFEDNEKIVIGQVKAWTTRCILEKLALSDQHAVDSMQRAIRELGRQAKTQLQTSQSHVAAARLIDRALSGHQGQLEAASASLSVASGAGIFSKEEFAVLQGLLDAVQAVQGGRFSLNFDAPRGPAEVSHLREAGGE